MRRRWSVVTAGWLVLASLDVVGQSTDTLRAKLDAIVKSQNEARQQYARDLEGKTTAAAQRPAIDRYLAAVDKNTSEVLRLVRANPTDTAVVEALTFVIVKAGRGPSDASYQAMEILLDHVREPGMRNLCGRIDHYGHFPVAERLLRAVMETHPNRDDRGQACYSLATYLRLQAQMVRRIRERPERLDEYVKERHKQATRRFVQEADPEALEKRSQALLERVIAEFADVKYWLDQRPLGAIAEGELFAARNVSVGKPAPEITGKDHQGHTFSLSDYRGKVVVLTFSGDWCGPCVGMYPQERQLVAKLKGKRFALLSVNTDTSAQTLAKSIALGTVTWRCWFDGGTTGPITTRWGVSFFPSIFVLDKAGIIRFKDLRGEELEKAVDLLLAEAGAAQVRPVSRPNAR
jgi:thiol-disulfide isomerase/thioredoxin